MADRPTTQRALVETGIALTSELSLEAVLERLVAAAASLTGARYAALGVVGGDRRSLERFVVHGLTDSERAAIGDPPRGRGLLGAVIDAEAPIRLDDLTADPRSVGFPPHHPPMRSFLGVPVLLRGTAYGTLYLTEKEGDAAFDAEDERVVTVLAQQAAVAIENARLYESERRWSSRLEALEEIAISMSEETDLEEQLQLVADRLRSLLGARLVAVALPRGDGTLAVRAGSGADLAGLVLHAGTKTARVLASGVSELVPSMTDDEEVDHGLAERFGATSGLIVPLRHGGSSLGVLVAADRLGDDPRFDGEDLRLAESYARRAAAAVDVSQRVARDALRRAVAAQELERRRLARELHDETGQALTSILLGLAAIEAAPTPEEARAAVGRLRDLAVSTLRDVRRLAVELRPAALDDLGLVPALRRLGRSASENGALDVQVEAHLGDVRLTPEVETAVYRIVQEALTNVAKHANARHVSIILTRKNGGVSVVIEDDGRGFDPGRAGDRGGLGLAGMTERVQLLDGSLAVESAPGSGTTLVLQLPRA